MDPRSLIVDANVLIDYAESEPQILTLTADVIGPVLIVRPILREVEQVGEKECDELGIDLVDPTLEQLREAASLGGALSFEDWLCHIFARDHELVCVTNDRRLRKECERQGVKVSWGLELMVELVALRELHEGEAVQVADAIRSANPTHITAAVIQRFREKIRGPAIP